jgi:hypothetical protein
MKVTASAVRGRFPIHERVSKIVLRPSDVYDEGVLARLNSALLRKGQGWLEAALVALDASAPAD